MAQTVMNVGVEGVWTMVARRKVVLMAGFGECLRAGLQGTPELQALRSAWLPSDVQKDCKDLLRRVAAGFWLGRVAVLPLLETAFEQRLAGRKDLV
jgi:hypothetical protein